MTPSAAEAAAEYARRGFAPVPVPFREKQPTLKVWQRLRITPAEVDRYFNGRQQNVGLILGVGGLTDVDLDSHEAIAAAPEFLPPTPFCFGRQSKPRSHWFYLTAPPAVNRQFEDPVEVVGEDGKKKKVMLVELRGAAKSGAAGQQTIVPPSTHVSGEPIRFEPGGRPEPAHVSAADLERAVAKTAAAALLARHWAGEGSRNKAFLALAGLVARAGWSEEEAAQFVRAIYRALWGAAADLRQAEAEVAHTFERFRDGAETTGTPTLAELINERVLRTALRWLNIDAGTAPRAERVVRPTDDGKIEVELRVDALAEIAEQCERILAEAEDSDIYQSGGRLVYPVREPAPDGGSTYGLATLDADGILLRLHERFRFLRPKPVKGGVERVPCDVPAALPRLMLARRGRWQYRRLRGVSAVPLLLPDGVTLVAEDGYDAESQLLFAGLPKIPEIPEHPKRSDAVQALERLFGLFGEFCFSSLLDQSVAVAAAMTAAVRPSLGPSPMLFVGAPSPGSGKSYLQAVIGALCAGLRPAVIASSGCDMVELDKRIVSSLLAGCTVLILDNLSYMLSSDVLCQVISAETPLKLRPLGASTEVTIEPQVLVLANGNNVRPAEDLLRRVIYCRLDPKTERPELRQYTHAPLEEALTNRGEYIADAITIIRAWYVAGQPERLEPLAGFQRWSDWIRSSLYWLTGIDVATSIERLREQDGALSNLEAVLTAWHGAFGSDPVTIKEVLREAEQESRAGLREALLAACGWRGELEPRRVGNWVESKLEREVGNLRFELVGKDSHSKVNLWRVARGPFK